MSVVNYIELKQYASTKIPNRSIGEGLTVLDLNLDGRQEIFLYFSSPRNPELPVLNPVGIIEVGSDGVLYPAFETVVDEDRSFPETGDEPYLIPDLDRFPIMNGPLQTSWLQDDAVFDFNGDGIEDIFIAGHGAEWPAPGTGFEDYESSDWSDLFFNDPNFSASWPGEDLQVVLGGSVPTIINVTNNPKFYHQSAAGDIDGDDDIDIVTHADGKTSLFINDGNASFTLREGPVSLQSPLSGQNWWEADHTASVSTLEVADFDKDGISEIIFGPMPTAYGTNTAGFFLEEYNTLTDSFTHTVIDYPDIAFANDGSTNIDLDYLISDKLTVGDIDNDGDQDFLVKFVDDKDDHYVGSFLYINKGDWEFDIIHYDQGATHGGNGPEVIDVNNDGLMDIVHPGWTLGKSYSSVLEMIYINQGNNSFKSLAELGGGLYEDLLVNPANPESIVHSFEVENINGKNRILLNMFGDWKGEGNLVIADLELKLNHNSPIELDGDGRFTGTASADIIISGKSNSTVLGGEGADIISGGAGDDQISGGTGNDKVTDSWGTDILNGDDGNDVIRAFEGGDTINGGAGADTIYGSRGDDVISGGNDDDVIYGDTFVFASRGADELSGGNGDDVMQGGFGVDTFIFNSGETGDNRIERIATQTADFEVGIDKIKLLGFGDDLTAANILAQWQDTDNGAKLTLADMSIQLTGINASDLSVNDFEFV